MLSLIFFLLTIVFATPVLQTAKRHVKENIDVFGERYSVGFLDLQFDRDLLTCTEMLRM